MPKILYSVPAGTPFAPRWLIQNEDGNYWDEKNQCWTTDIKDAGLFLTSNEAGLRLYELMETHIPGTFTKFAMPFIIEVKGCKPVSITDLRDWLAQNIELRINGVLLNESMVIVIAEWDKLKEIQ